MGRKDLEKLTLDFGVKIAVNWATDFAHFEGISWVNYSWLRPDAKSRNTKDTQKFRAGV
jgi:hypothetical protein